MVIVADTSAILALMDRGDPFHTTLQATFAAGAGDWVVPWAIIPELDHLARKRLGAAAAGAIGADLAEGRFQIEWGAPGDLRRGLELDRAYRNLSLGLVDGVVMAVAERLEARAIATLDLRDFGAVTLNGNPEIWPRDL
ncbi:MAG: PIN domain-containing protein [Gemmatimonadetes bacterium]|nr:PIN domain-containing protein [Gemmatimonadota bacterium]MYE71624.1 PIN domain-containing protein [Gemmatimonadota bacterium]MYJ69031.1 PIN domain-containing protein [Gemmatimonadota bacterium]